MKYRVTEMGFIGRLVRPGDIIEVDGPPPIGGLVPIDDKPAPQPVVAQAQANPAARSSKKSRTPPADTGDAADVI